MSFIERFSTVSSLIVSFIRGFTVVSVLLGGDVIILYRPLMHGRRQATRTSQIMRTSGNSFRPQLMMHRYSMCVECGLL